MEKQRKTEQAEDPQAEERRQQEQKRLSGRYAAQQRGRLVANHLKKVLSEPERVRQEHAFALEHEGDSDRQLFDYVKAEKRRQGKRMKEYSVIGYRYLVRRLGPWNKIMEQVNRELKAEKSDKP